MNTQKIPDELLLCLLMFLYAIGWALAATIADLVPAPTPTPTHAIPR